MSQPPLSIDCQGSRQAWPVASPDPPFCLGAAVAVSTLPQSLERHCRVGAGVPVGEPPHERLDLRKRERLSVP